MRSRFLLPIALVGFYLFILFREVGNLLFALATGNSYSVRLLWHFIPDFQVMIASTTPKLEILKTLSGPIFTLSIGYGFLLTGIGRKPGFPIALLVAMLTYLCLILDPVYFGLAGLLSKGGEPEQLALNGLSKSITSPIAIIILVFNIYLIRRLLIPDLRAMLSEEEQ